VFPLTGDRVTDNKVTVFWCCKPFIQASTGHRSGSQSAPNDRESNSAPSHLASPLLQREGHKDWAEGGVGKSLLHVGLGGKAGGGGCCGLLKPQ
jgi:hypothetical protein